MTFQTTDARVVCLFLAACDSDRFAPFVGCLDKLRRSILDGD